MSSPIDAEYFSHHEQIMICGELRHASGLMESNRMEEAHSHLPERDAHVHRESERKGGERESEARKDIKDGKGGIHWDVSNVA